MQASNRLKTTLDQGKKAWGAWQMLPGANLSRVLARSGVSWVLVDCEHGNLDGMLEIALLRYRGEDLVVRGMLISCRWTYARCCASNCSFRRVADCEVTRYARVDGEA